MNYTKSHLLAAGLGFVLFGLANVQTEGANSKTNAPPARPLPPAPVAPRPTPQPTPAPPRSNPTVSDTNAKRADQERADRERASREKADREKADRANREKADRERADREKADRSAREKADKAAADRVAADRARMEKAAAEKAAAAKANAEKAAADKAKADKAVADKVAANKAAEKAKNDKAAADKVAADKAKAEKVAADKAKADKAAADKVAVDRAKAADKAKAGQNINPTKVFGLPQGNHETSGFEDPKDLRVATKDGKMGPKDVSSDYKLKPGEVWEKHEGIDFSSRDANGKLKELEYKAGISGTVVVPTGMSPGYNTISVKMADGKLVQYLHNSAVMVKVGDKVTPDTVLGKTGGKGPKGDNEYTIHLHVQVKDPHSSAGRRDQGWG
ncbi:MAG: peptidoglycan DD-metalloendopeptidase family protein [Verrucomicrobia bacterium]|nr:peptidoglycan DD-metalloendopeptidase family protein [Verrucomicrobiota bacterium]